jgi:hypothetical protein
MGGQDWIPAFANDRKDFSEPQGDPSLRSGRVAIPSRCKSGSSILILFVVSPYKGEKMDTLFPVFAGMTRGISSQGDPGFEIWVLNLFRVSIFGFSAY